MLLYTSDSTLCGGSTAVRVGGVDLASILVRHYRICSEGVVVLAATECQQTLHISWCHGVHLRRPWYRVGFTHGPLVSGSRTTRGTESIGASDCGCVANASSGSGPP